MKGYAAYAKVQPTNEGYRDLEYKVLGAVTGGIIKANEEGKGRLLVEKYMELVQSLIQLHCLHLRILFKSMVRL